MNKSKYLVLFLLITAISLVSFGYVSAAQPPKDCDECKAWVSEMCSQPGMDEDCEKNMYDSACGHCSSGGSTEGAQTPVIYIRPSDDTGEYYINDNNEKDYVSFKNWNGCMQYFGDADKCSKIVTDPCESCMGTCMDSRSKGFIFSAPCSVLCRSECAKTGSKGEE